MSADETELPVGETGELWIKGPNVFQGPTHPSLRSTPFRYPLPKSYHIGYLNNPTGTANAITADGYLRTGDVGYQDASGNVYITDRMKELIKYKGFQVAPAELEGVLLTHPAVNDVAVLGVYDEGRATEVPRAYVVVAKGTEPSKRMESEIVAWVRGRVVRHKQLRGGVGFVDEVPKSASGKILRRILRERVAKKGEAKAKL
jgi:acyl-CoA synthetase (AMP-forming)/AMP-acid ligase II